MNNFEKLGIVVTELALVKRHLKNVTDKYLKMHNGNFFAEYEMVNSKAHVEATKKIKDLQSRKIKLLNKCKKKIKSEKCVNESSEVQLALLP